MSFLESIPPFVYIAIVAFGVVLGTVAYLILLERKVASWIQDRIGPNRAGPRGLFQPLADGLKMFVKEDYRPAGVDKYLFTIAPALMMLVVIVAMAVIPWGGVHEVSRTINTAEIAPEKAVPLAATIVRVEQSPSVAGSATVTYRYPFQIANLSIGVLFIVAVLSLAVYGVVMAGWASNNKFSFLGGLRATAQMISYEVPLGLSLLTIILMFGTLDLGQIVEKQAHYWLGFIPAWNVFSQPLTFVVFLICIHAEANRAPFDLPEAEQELVGGYHTEYTSMRLGLLLLGEYAEIVVSSALCVGLFFGGWHLPGLNGPDAGNPAVTNSLLVVLIRCLVYFIKVLLLIFVFMWVRWSLPRFRFDQLMRLAWRGLVPLSLLMLLCTAVVLYFRAGHDEAFRLFGRIDVLTALMLLGANIAVLAAVMLISRLLPPLAVNRRLMVEGSRFSRAPLATDNCP